MLVVACDTDHGDTYLAETLRLTRGRCDTGALPIVRVLRVLDYPRQCSILYEDVPNDVAPIPEGTITRLTILRPIVDPREVPQGDWDASVYDALMRAVERTREPGQRVMLLRHLAGIHTTERVVLTIPESEVQETDPP